MFTYCISLSSTLVEYILYPCTESTILRARTDVEGCLRALYSLLNSMSCWRWEFQLNGILEYKFGHNIKLFATIAYCWNSRFQHSRVSASLGKKSLKYEYNFLFFLMFISRNNFFIGVNYGSHPWHWYLSNALPSLLGPLLLPLLIGARHAPLVLLLPLLVNIGALSLLPHKVNNWIIKGSATLCLSFSKIA